MITSLGEVLETPPPHISHSAFFRGNASPSPGRATLHTTTSNGGSTYTKICRKRETERRCMGFMMRTCSLFVLSDFVMFSHFLIIWSTVEGECTVGSALNVRKRAPTIDGSTCIPWFQVLQSASSHSQKNKKNNLRTTTQNQLQQLLYCSVRTHTLLLCSSVSHRRLESRGSACSTHPPPSREQDPTPRRKSQLLLMSGRCDGMLFVGLQIMC